MVIQHNMLSLNAGRQWKQRTRKIAKSTEKLSSGYKVNRAADDAAGLCISEKMRRQIRGLHRASENIEDGVSLCQVADGALNETVDILQRMRELAIQSANGTNSESDRQNIEEEVAQLRYEIDRIAQTTEFNATIHPLNSSVTYIEKTGTENPDSPDIPNVPGSEAPDPDASDSDVSDPDAPDPNVPSIPDTLPAPKPDEGIIKEETITFKTNKACIYDGKSYKAGDMLTVTGLTTNGAEIWINCGSVYAQGVYGAGFSNEMGTLTKSDLKVDSRGYIYYVDLSGAQRYAFYVTDPSHLGSFTGQYGNPDPIHFATESVSADSVRDGWARYMKVADLYDKDPTKPTDPDPPKPTDPDPAKPTDPDSPKPSAPYSPTMPVGGYYVCSGDPITIHAGDSSQMSNKIPIYMVTLPVRGLE